MHTSRRPPSSCLIAQCPWCLAGAVAVVPSSGGVRCGRGRTYARNGGGAVPGWDALYKLQGHLTSPPLHIELVLRLRRGILLVAGILVPVGGAGGAIHY